MLCKLINSYIKISSLGLMIKHEQFYLNHWTKHINSQKLFFENTVSGIVKPSVTIPEKSQIIGSFSEPGFHGHFRPYSNQCTIYFTIFHTFLTQQPCPVMDGSMDSKKNSNNLVPFLGPIKQPLTASFDSNICKVLKTGIKHK